MSNLVIPGHPHQPKCKLTGFWSKKFGKLGCTCLLGAHMPHMKRVVWAAEGTHTRTPLTTGGYRWKPPTDLVTRFSPL